MKRILLLTILLASTMSVFAQDGARRVYDRDDRNDRRAAGASVRIKLTTNRMVSASIDDKYYEKRTNSITIGDIPAGRHYLKVFNFREGRSGNGKANLVFSGYVDLKASSFSECIVDPYQRKMKMRSQTFFGKNDPDDYYENWNNNPRDRDNDRWNDRNRDRNRDNWNDNTLSNQDVTELGTRVKDRMMDADKLQLMQSVLSNKSYYTEQLRTMFTWLSFEGTKLEFAKWAYDNTLDKENYWKLEDIFSFSSSKSELTEYIQGRPNTNNNNNNSNHYRDNRDRNNYNSRTVNDQDISDLGTRVKDRIGDSEKQKLVQSVLNDRQYYTAQVRTILGWFSFESTKLELAKWAYDNTLDKDNYWKLEDMFSFSSSKTELTEYTQSRR